MKFLFQVKYLPLVLFVVLSLIVLAVWNFAGCSGKAGASGVPLAGRPVILLDFADDASNVGQLAEPIKATITLYRAGASAPARGQADLPPGTWVVPTTVYAGVNLSPSPDGAAAPDPGAGEPVRLPPPPPDPGGDGAPIYPYPLRASK